MFKPEDFAFVSDDLEMIYRGETRLHAPELQGSVQINATEYDGRALLCVTRNRHGIHVMRADGEPLQVEVTHEIPDVESPLGIRNERSKVFEEHVDAVTFTKQLIEDYMEVPLEFFKPESGTAKKDISWMGWVAAGQNVRPTERWLIQRFASDLGVFVSRKQEATRPYPRLRRSIRSFKLRHGLTEI